MQNGVNVSFSLILTTSAAATVMPHYLKGRELMWKNYAAVVRIQLNKLYLGKELTYWAHQIADSPIGYDI